jgi:hypothetical protein
MPTFAVVNSEKLLMNPASHIRYSISLSEVFTFRFVMLGPLRAIGPFSRITAGLDAVALRRAAIVSASISSAAGRARGIDTNARRCV